MHLIVKLKLFTPSYRVIILVFFRSPYRPYTIIPKETLSLNTRGRKICVIEFCGNRLSSFSVIVVEKLTNKQTTKAVENITSLA